jgi:hypothetical protein
LIEAKLLDASPFSKPGGHKIMQYLEHNDALQFWFGDVCREIYIVYRSIKEKEPAQKMGKLNEKMNEI